MEYSRILIDTSIVIDFIRKKDKKKTVLWSLMEDYECNVSSITVFEQYNGASSGKHYQILDTIFKRINTVEFTFKTAITASDIYKTLKNNNKLIEFRDILIAASSISENIPLATLNIKHFERIDNLILI